MSCKAHPKLLTSPCRRPAVLLELNLRLGPALQPLPLQVVSQIPDGDVFAIVTPNGAPEMGLKHVLHHLRVLQEFTVAFYTHRAGLSGTPETLWGAKGGGPTSPRPSFPPSAATSTRTPPSRCATSSRAPSSPSQPQGGVVPS